MADVRTFTCDRCGILKKDSNHWFQVKVTATEIIITTIAGMPDRTHDVCGMNCLQAVVQTAAGALVGETLP
jgi:hypothetical protein